MARRQGKKRGSKLDGHADFILALVDADDKDIALGEIVERLADERGVRVGTTCVWTFFDQRGLTYKKRRCMRPSSGRAGPRGCPRSPAGVVRRATRP